MQKTHPILFGIPKYKMFTSKWQAVVNKGQVKEGTVCRDEERGFTVHAEKLF